MDGEDEEVIFQNRALHQALYEMGVQDIDTEPVLANEFQELSNGTSDEKTSETTDERKINRIPSDFLTRLFLSQPEITSINDSFRRQTLNRLRVSPLLSSDDRCFLASFILDESNNDQKDQQVSECRSRMLIGSIFNIFGPLVVTLWMFYVFILSLCLVVDSKSIPDLLHVGEVDSFYFFMLSLALGLILIYHLLKFHLHRKLSTRLKNMDCTIKEFEEGADKLSRIQRKCVRRIRESELAARGFTLTSLSSNANSDSPILTQIDKWCPNFRDALFSGNVDIISDLEKSYKFLTDSIPLVVDFKWLNFKQSHLSTSSSSSGLLKENGSSTSDGDDQDIIPTTKLVTSQELLNIHISAFVRRLALSFVTENCKDSQINPFFAVSKAVQTCLQSMDQAASLLEKHHSFYRAVYMSADKPETFVCHKDSKKPKSPLESFYVFVNSLDVHLQTVFRMTRDLTVCLENLVDRHGKSTSGDKSTSCDEKTRSTSDGDSINAQDRSQWMEALKGIKGELDSCKSCYEEAIKFLSQEESKASSPAANLLNPSHDSTTMPVKSENIHKPMAVIPDADPVIEDQVFEAVIGSDGDERKTSQRKTYTAAEKAQIRQKREDLSRFKQELKAVVDHRAINQRKREERALARTQGKQISTVIPSEMNESNLGEGDKDNDSDSGSLSAVVEMKITDESPVPEETIQQSLPQAVAEENLPMEMSRKLENECSSLNQESKNEYGAEKMSLLAAKLDSADSDEKHLNPSELPWAPLLRNECTGVAAVVVDEDKSGKGKNSSGYSSSLSQQLPYDENWRSSIEKTKARHWEMCEKIIQENKGAGDGDGENLKSSDSVLDTSGNLNGSIGPDLDTSSFVDISNDDLLFYPLDTDINSNANNNGDDSHHFQKEARALEIQQEADKASSSCSSNSQIVCPKSVNPEEEGFRNVHGAYISRHNFTASGKGQVLEEALKVIEKQREGDVRSDDTDQDDDKVVHPNRKRHRAGREDGDPNDSRWVNISHVEFVSCNGNQYELLRQKDMDVEDIASRTQIPSPHPASSLNASLALMAAARSRQFNLGGEEHFIDDGDSSDDACIEEEYCQAISAARLNDDVNRDAAAARQNGAVKL